jgi:hypothetical protein
MKLRDRSGKLHAERNNPEEIPVQQYDRDGRLVSTFTMAEFEKAMRGPRKSPKRAGRPFTAKSKKH